MRAKGIKVLTYYVSTFAFEIEIIKEIRQMIYPKMIDFAPEQMQGMSQIHDYMRTLFPDQDSYNRMMRFLKLVVEGKRPNRPTVFYGSGGNGKTLFLNLLGALGVAYINPNITIRPYWMENYSQLSHHLYENDSSVMVICDPENIDRCIECKMVKKLLRINRLLYNHMFSTTKDKEIDMNKRSLVIISNRRPTNTQSCNLIEFPVTFESCKETYMNICELIDKISPYFRDYILYYKYHQIIAFCSVLKSSRFTKEENSQRLYIPEEIRDMVLKVL